MRVLHSCSLLPAPGTAGCFYVPAIGFPKKELPCRFIDTAGLASFSDQRKRRRCNRASLLAIETLSPSIRGALAQVDPARVGIYTYLAGEEDIDTLPLFWRSGESLADATSRISFRNKLLFSPGLLDAQLSIELGVTGPGFNFISLMTSPGDAFKLIESDLADRQVDLALLTAVLSLENLSAVSHFGAIPAGATLAESAVSLLLGPGPARGDQMGGLASRTSEVTFGPMWDIIRLSEEEPTCEMKTT